MYNKVLDIQYVKGVGPKLSKLFNKKGIYNTLDALFFLPRDYEDRTKISKIQNIEPLKYNIIKAKIKSVDLIRTSKVRRSILNIKVSDDTGVINCKWFNFNQKYMLNSFKPGVDVIVSGNTSLYAGGVEFYHPEIEILDKDFNNIHYGRVVPIYSETQGLSKKVIRKIMYGVISNHLDSVTEYMSEDILKRNNFPSLVESFSEIHFPSSTKHIDDLRNFNTLWQKRLSFDEFFFLELALSLRRANIKKTSGISFEIKKEWCDMIESSFPFKLTNSQKDVLSDVFQDMKNSFPMNRLIQGDVGSGKTVISFYAAVLSILNGYQAAMMVPTEILAEQHYNNFKNIFGDNFKAALLTGSLSKKAKDSLKKDIEEGNINFIIGTHALIEEDIYFKKLGFVVLDEQHRFGVEQRLKLISKGRPDVMVMTATPIPRTLTMTVYGDLDVSVITEKPKGRGELITKLVYDNKRDVVYDFIKKELSKGRQAYFIYPLVEESEKLMLKNAKEEASKLSQIFSDFKVSLVHGKMRSEEKNSVMSDFKKGSIDLLVSTTVIEVGVDVANASIMFIEHPERFGLSQLHQLRGRIGRGSERSVCILMASRKLTENAKLRLNKMVETNDGFAIAEEDLAIRGPGEVLGTRQHGIPDFRVGSLIRDMKVLMLARSEARSLISRDPFLSFSSSKNIKEILLSKYRNKIDFIKS